MLCSVTSYLHSVSTSNTSATFVLLSAPVAKNSRPSTSPIMLRFPSPALGPYVRTALEIRSSTTCLIKSVALGTQASSRGPTIYTLQDLIRKPTHQSSGANSSQGLHVHEGIGNQPDQVESEISRKKRPWLNDEIHDVSCLPNETVCIQRYYCLWYKSNLC